MAGSLAGTGKCDTPYQGLFYEIYLIESILIVSMRL